MSVVLAPMRHPEWSIGDYQHAALTAEQTMRRSRAALFGATWSFAVGAGWCLVIASVYRLSGGGWEQVAGLEVPFEAYFMMALLVALSELRPIVMTRFDGEAVSVAQAFVFASLYIWGLEPAILLMAGSVLLSELRERKTVWKLLFNVGQYVVAVSAAAVFIGGVQWQADARLGVADLLWIAVSWVVYHLVNLALVAGAVQTQTWWEAFTDEFWFYTASALSVLALSPLVAVVATAYDNSWLLLPLLMLPLLAVQRTAQMAKEREHRALHDPLTGLPNRLLLTDRIENSLARSSRTGGRVVVIFLDLDLFKTINDGLGHAVGDSVLVDVAKRLTSVLRPGDTLARFSGDEFAIVCESIPDHDIDALATRIQNALQPAFTFGSHEVTVTASIGVATATPHSTAESLLREADSAMYRAKSAGRDQVAHFHLSMHEAATARLDDQFGLRRALERGEFRAFYQPIIDIPTGAVVGMEALIRWQHPERGLMSPDRFIPLAEETGLILPMGAWMLDHCLEQLTTWREQTPSARDLWVAVNLSPRQLTDPNLLHTVDRALRNSGLPPELLHLEITETAVMHTADRSTETLEDLRALGLRLAIDDFGTGYSSLGRLKKLPVSTLKIDRSFVDGIATDTSDLSIVDAIVNMARSLNLDVVAEGVETREHLEILHSLGTDMGQGYLWSRPLPAEELTDWIGRTATPSDLPHVRPLRRRR